MKAPVPRLELKGVTKRFPGVLANDDVSLKVGPGEIHALLGENGAGKSTLVKIIYGVLKADAGEMFWNGTPAAVASPRAARQLGIGMVFQHFSLFEAMTVMENIALGLDEAVPRRRLERRIRDILETYHLPLDPHRHVHTLSVGERQRIEIVRSLLGSPKLLIMDEPTSVLTPQEVERLFETLRRLAAEGCSILYISHKLQEIKELCSRATILRGGRNVGECVPAKVSTREMAEKMIGGELRDVTGREGAASGKTSFSVSGLNVPAPSAFATSLKEISFSVAAGEILGIAGVAGNGQNELLAALDGETTDVGGTAVRIGETPAGRLDAGERRKLGLCAVPEERNGHGAVSDFPLWENVVLT
ncbi:MAG: ABC transporter ATP-binding protein, partial [Flavobacteriaceae bacterium]